MAFATAPNATSITLLLRGTGDVTIDWGDGSDDTYTLAASSNTTLTHNYAAAGQYTFAFSAGEENVTEWHNDNGNYGYNYADLPRGLTYFVHGGQNTGSGDYADLPSGLTYFAHDGQNTGSGNYADLPSGLTYFAHYGQNTGSGNYADLPSGLTVFAHGGQNTGFATSSAGPPNLTYCRLDSATRETVDRLIQHAYSRRNGVNCNYDLQFGSAEPPTDTMRALADSLVAGELGSATITFDTAGTPAETDDEAPYNTLVTQEPLAGFYPTGDPLADAAIESVSTQLAAGREPTITSVTAEVSGNTVTAAAVVDDPGNGTVVTRYQFQTLEGVTWTSSQYGTANTYAAATGETVRVIGFAENDGGQAEPFVGPILEIAGNSVKKKKLLLAIAG